MNKTNLILVLLIIFAAFVCMSGVASAAPVSLDAIYVGNTMVDLNWSKYPSTDFSKYTLYMNESPIHTTDNRSATFYRDSELTRGTTYIYKICVYNSSGGLVKEENATTSAKTGDVHGTITIDTTWTAANSPYNLTGAVTVEEGATLTIEPGVTVNNAKLYLHGPIYVDGASFIGEGLSIHNSSASTIKNCIFDGSGTAGSGIYLESCNDSTVTGNTIVNYSARWWGRGVYLNSSSNNTISSNNVSNNYDGIHLYNSSGNTISSNNVSNSYNGVDSYNSSDNTITNNHVSNNEYGILLRYNSSNNMISSNNVSNNEDGIRLEYLCNNSIITGNTVNSNSYMSIYVFYSSYNTISSNNVSNNENYGIWVDYSEDSTITNNIVSNNYWGIWLSDSNRGTVTANTASNNGFVGIYLTDSRSSTLTDNTVNSNEYDGIWLYYSGNSTLTGNTMSGNKYNFGVYAWALSDYILNIDTSNLVDGKPIYYWVDKQNQQIPDDAGFVGIVNSRDITVRDLTLTNNSKGVLFAYTNNSRIENVNASNNAENGIYLLHSHGNNLTNNTASYNDYSGSYGDYSGIYLYMSSNNTLYHNTASYNDYSGIYLYKSSNNNTLYHNTVAYNGYGIYVYDLSNNNTLTNNNASNNIDGFRLYLSRNTTLTNNTANSNNEFGIWVSNSNNNILSHNTANSNIDYGFFLDDSSNNTLSYSNASNNDDSGIYMDYSNNNTLFNNTANSNTDDGVYLYHSNNNTLSSNTASNNEVGIFLWRSSNYNMLSSNTVSNNDYYGIYLNSASDNRIYDNYFNNSFNAYDDGNNIWNITKTNGTNIVGGPYLGGNYWSDYKGNDTDGDRLGDTLLPYNCSGNIKNGGDYRPLMIDVSISDLVVPKVLVDGENATVNATVHTNANFNVSTVTVQLLVNNKSIQNITVEIPQNSSTNVTFDGWNVSWSVKDTKRQPINITVVVDPDNEISDTNNTNNTVTREFPLAKGEKKADADGRGFIADSTKSAVYAVPIAIWFDDDAFKFTFLGVTWVGGVPTRHYNPIAMDVAVLNDIETDFNYTQFPNGSVSLSISNFTSDAERTFTTFWKNSSGIVIVNDTRKSAIVGAPIASYLNWPMAPSSLLKKQTAAKNLTRKLNITYVLVIADDKNAVKAIINDSKNLDLEENQTLIVKGFAVEPLDNLEPTDLFKEVLEAFGDKSSSIVVTNTRSNSAVASAPLAAFYKSMILDVRDVVTQPVDYSPDTFATLNPINNHVQDIVWRAGKHNILDFIGRYMPAKNIKTLYLVGNGSEVPFGIVKEPAGFKAADIDKDWIATDYLYYKVGGVIPGGRMPLDDKDNLNYVARALQFDELPVGERDVGDGWEDNIMGVGIYSKDGKRHWAKNKVWWLDSVVYQVRDLSNKTEGMEITRLFECAGRHNGGWGKNWYRLDNQQRKLIKKAPLYWDTHPLTPPENPTGGGNRGDNVNNDNDRVGSENNNGRLPCERIIDNNDNNRYDPGIDVILDDGLVAGIGSNWFWTPGGARCGKDKWCYALTVDEEVWDGFDNDGDGTIDEDCSYWRLLEVQEVYNEFLTKQDPDIDPGGWIDLIDINLEVELVDKGIIIYSGHSWTDHWAISNIGGADTTDTRTPDEVTLSHYEVPNMAPSLVIASSCGSCRLWEANCIAEVFLKNGALAYIGSTSLAYGSSDELRQQIFNQIAGGRLHIGRAFKSAVDDLDQNDLWANRFNESNIFANKTRYEFNLFGLGSTEIDPGEGEKRVTYGTPVYDDETKTWSMNITFDIPEPTEIEDAEGNVTEIIFPTDLLKWLSDDASYPALYLLPFGYELPIGGNFSNISLINATVYKTYNLSQYKLKDYGKWPEEIVPLNVSLNETIEEETELYNGTLFPDVLFVNDSEHDSFANRDRVFGSVAALQVNGTINKTIVYDEIMLKLTYTAPIGVEETHVVDGNDLAVYAAIVSTDGKTHLVKPSLVIETVGGIIYKEVSAENITVGETPQTVTFEVSDIELPKYVGSVIVTEEGKYVAETSFTVTPSKIVINEVYPYPSAVQDAKEEWIELYNAGELEVNLTGWRIIDGDGDLNYTIPANDSDWDGVLESGSYLVFHIGGTLDTPAEDIYANFTSGVLNDSNDSVSLLSANGTGIDFVRYGNCTDEPPAGTFWTGVNPDAPIQGQSLGRDKDSTDTNDCSDWENTGGIDVDGPTPGLRNFGTKITSFTPPSPVNDTVCIWRTFNVIINQMVNVSWYLNNSLLFSNESVTEAKCTLHAEVVGEHNVSAIASNPNGTDMQTWAWNVTAVPAPTVIKPNGGEEIPGGSIYDIKWNVAKGSYDLAPNPIAIYNSTDNGGSWTQIATNEPNDGRYSWNVPNINPSSSNCLVKVEASDVRGNKGDDTSDSVFTITRTTSSESETIPAGGSATVEGPPESDTTVNVTATGNVTVTVAYYSENPHPEVPKPAVMLEKYVDISVSDKDNVTWPIYVEMHYTDDEIAGLNESSLGLYHYKDEAWHRCGDTGVNADENYVWANVTKDECAGSPFVSGGSGAPEPPNITSFAPPSPVNDTVCTWRTFNVTVNQTVNVSWYLNDSLLFTNESVTEANCTLHAEVAGEHNVSAIASNPNGTDMQTWIWNVTEAPSPCYIATATYGTPLDSNIDVLRDFRDNVLMTNPIGKAFVSTYYGTSPAIADALRANDGLRTVTRLTLITPLVYLVQFALNGILFVFILGLAAGLLLRKDRKKILKSVLAGIGAILVFIVAIFSLGFVGYAIPFCAVVGAYMLPFVIPLSVFFSLCALLNLNIRNFKYVAIRVFQFQ